MTIGTEEDRCEKMEAFQTWVSFGEKKKFGTIKEVRFP
jgi:hypothetical protein